ncbi:deoxyribose-phosphate aldolase [Flavobacterium limnosediminis JC2902]|uniref:Deoxyribose-phosphate aldolase n=1 Tax=Flavobacterium limnosediminis JC2902 TaxID=1341181 RepID=V6SS37_9FLAO|nr:deoxyribose-phosphate aldolase [Flavobacterium limnosediminis JC2902]
MKTASQAGLTKAQNLEVVKGFIQEAIDEKFKLIMVRPEMVALANEMVSAANSKVAVGTVIDFPKGNGLLDEKLKEAVIAIKNGADDLDYVVDYEAFKRGETDVVKKQVLEGTRLGLSHNKVVKWIIEVAALNDHEIVQLTALIKNVVIANFKEEQYAQVFVKSSTGFFEAKKGLPNGATVPKVKLMIENAFPLSVKAAGGVRTYEEALEMISLGVKRIGTSSAKAIVSGQKSESDY